MVEVGDPPVQLAQYQASSEAATFLYRVIDFMTKNAIAVKPK